MSSSQIFNSYYLVFNPRQFLTMFSKNRKHSILHKTFPFTYGGLMLAVLFINLARMSSYVEDQLVLQREQEIKAVKEKYMLSHEP